MYHAQQQIYTETKRQLKNRISIFIKKNPLKRCKALRRNIRLERYIEANDSRQDARIRYSAFFPAMEILQKGLWCEKSIIDGFVCFELKGKAKNGEIVTIHLREEEYDKDKILFLISTFYKEK